MSYKYEDIRNFYFENETGERIDCQKIDGNLFFYNVTGLGYEEDIEYVQMGNSFIPNKKEIKQNQIGGDLEFYNMTYDEYCNFVDFILKATSLKLIYVPKKTVRTEYYRDIDFIKIDKQEEDDYNILTCPILMSCKSLWYEENTTIYTIEPLSDEIRWDFRWDSRFTDYSVRNLSYINNGHTEAPVLIEIDGNVINPKIELYVEGELYQTVEITVEIKEYEKLIYDTRENQFCIDKQNTDGSRTSLFSLDNIKFENDNVIRLPCNRSCEIRLTADNEILNALIKIFPRYKAV